MRKMSAQVKFFPIKFSQNDDELKRLSKLQEEIELYHAEIAYQSHGLSFFQKVIFKESSHNNVRRNIRLIKQGE
jgi:hypothetical protein